MDNSNAKSIVFYDIASAPPRRTYAPNPWKTRLALNFKGLPYTTAWVELPDVTSTRKALGVPPCRLNPDGSDFYTLPVIHDLSTGKKVGDTFDIALYLDHQYPTAPKLMKGDIGLLKAWNTQVDAAFTRHIQLAAHGMPLNPTTAEETRQFMCRRAGLDNWDQATVKGDARVKLKTEFKASLGELAVCYTYAQDQGQKEKQQEREQELRPFLEGDHPTYADLIVGAWLGMLKETLPRDEWAELQTWHQGRWGLVYMALQEFYRIK